MSPPGPAPRHPAARTERRRGLVWTLLLTVCAFGGGAVSARLGQAAPGHSPYSLVDQLARVLVLIENEYVDAVDRQRLLQGAIKGMVAELDPHSAYLPPRDFAVLQDDTRGEFAGIGVEVDFRNDRVTVISAIEGSPAQRAGMLPGDLVVAIDGLGVSGKNASELVKLMRGPAGTTVRVSVRRPGREDLLNFTLARQVIEVSSVLGADLAGQIAYLRIKQFQSKTDTELLEAVATLRQRMGGTISGVLLDLRNNPGGLVAAATSVADEFLPGGVVYSTRHRGNVVDQVRASSGGSLQDCPMVVLVNEFSASASELLAGALQDHKRATVIGARTFGKGSVQSIVDLPGGGGLRLTTMRYYTPGGRAIQVEGITPDVAVDSSLGDGGNPVLREHDLENHLRSESRSAAPAPPAAPGAQPPAAQAPSPAAPDPAAPGGEGEKPGLSPTHLGVARSVPHDPTGGPDHALSIAYVHLRGLLSPSPATQGAPR